TALRKYHPRLESARCSSVCVCVAGSRAKLPAGWAGAADVERSQNSPDGRMDACSGRPLHHADRDGVRAPAGFLSLHALSRCLSQILLGQTPEDTDLFPMELFFLMFG